MSMYCPSRKTQIQQRGLEAEAEKISRIKNAEATSQARQIEAAGSRIAAQAADAEAYRNDRIGKIASEQLARDGALISKNPLLIQKAFGRQLSDKISVIIAPPSDGGFIGHPARRQQAESGRTRRSSCQRGRGVIMLSSPGHLAHRHCHRHPGPVRPARRTARLERRNRPCSGRATAWKSAARKATSCKSMTTAANARVTCGRIRSTPCSRSSQRRRPRFSPSCACSRMYPVRSRWASPTRRPT